MKLMSSPAKTVTSIHPAILGYFMLLLVSGCGLAMDNEDRLERGEKAFAEGDYRAAIIDAKDVLRDEPDNLRGRLLLGRASVKSGDGPSAEKELRRAMQLGSAAADVAAGMARALLIQGKFEEVLNDVPFQGLASTETEAEVRAMRGDAYLGLDQPGAAREMYSSALQLQPENLDARLGIVSSFMAENNFAQARGGIDQILETFPDNPRVWLYSGSFSARTGNFETAEANFKVALDLANAQGDQSAHVQALTGLSESLLQQQDVESARVHIDQLVVEAPQSLQTKILLARVAYNDEDWTTAQQNLQQVLQAAPNYRPAQTLLGAVHLRSGNLSQAEMYLSAAVAAVPTDIRARQLLAETLLQMRNAEDAQAALAPIVGGPDADLMSLQMAARASLGRRDVDEALEYLRRSVEDNPGNADLRFQLAATLLQTGRHDEAQTVLDAIDVAGSEENTYRRDALRVLTAIREGKSVAALEAAQQVVDTYGDRFGAFNLMGAVQLANRDMDGARMSFEQAAKLDPNDMVSRQYLAAIDEAEGKLGSATDRYKAILAERPDAAWAMYALGRIAVRQEDFEGAAENFRRASEAAPGDADYRLSLVKAERQLGNSEQAMALLEQDVDGTLEHFQSALMLGALKAESGDIDEALNIAGELKKRYPDSPASYAFEGETHVIDGNLPLADGAYEKALELGPVKSFALRSYQIKRQLGGTDAERPLVEFLEARPLDNEVRILLAEAYTQTENLSKSIATYERVVSEEPANAIALNNLAWNYYLVDDPRAIETAQRAHDAMPDNGAIVDTLGWIMVQRGSVEDGERLLREAVEMEGGRAEIRYHHAVALAKLGRKEEARSSLEQVLAGDDEFASRSAAEKLLAEL
ncbi:MAG: PEP-CTERM system TPR-repeat protein PrsT [Gammaproteobacteria bacterium]|nr:PEP-CTERM system TPR-repeat protein PrsT [Gammaproteobacteria bacterium]